MAWRPAYSLETLKSQLDTNYPGWTFLGFIGDQSHASVPSDHNINSAGVVCALDIGPGGGLDIHKLADNLASSPHPDLKYIISNRRIAEWQNGFQWRPYSGSDPHDTHIHVSVGRGPDGQSVQPYDDRVKWNVTGGEEMLTEDNFYRLYRMGVLNDPDQSEASKFTRDPNLAVETLWNNGGKDYKQKAEALRVNEIRAQKFKELGKVVGKDPDKDGIDAIINEVIKLASQPANGEAQKKLDQIKGILNG